MWDSSDKIDENFNRILGGLTKTEESTGAALIDYLSCKNDDISSLMCYVANTSNVLYGETPTVTSLLYKDYLVKVNMNNLSTKLPEANFKKVTCTSASFKSALNCGERECDKMMDLICPDNIDCENFSIPVPVYYDTNVDKNCLVMPSFCNYASDDDRETYKNCPSFGLGKSAGSDEPAGTDASESGE